MNPKRTLQQLRGSIGATAFDLFVNRELGWVYRPVHQENDFGIDGYIDIVKSGKLTGAGLAVQIKCGKSYFANRSNGNIRYVGEIKHLNYYYNLRQPVLLIVLDENGQNGRWVQFRLEKTLPTDSKSDWWIEVPWQNKLTRSVAKRWSAIAGPTADIRDAVSREWNAYRTNAFATHLVVGIRKEEVTACAVDALFRWQSQLLKTREMLLAKRAKVEFYFSGWDDDKRELHQIPEVRRYFEATLKLRFPWIYWLEPDNLWQGYLLLFACGCDTSAARVGRQYLIRPTSVAALRQWMQVNFDALNRFTGEHRIPMKFNKECSKNLTRFVNRMQQG